MLKTIEALFDGKVFRPTEPVSLQPNTRVQITIETAQPAEKENISFLQTARMLSLEGPPDWSEHLEDYLYGDTNNGG